MRWQRSSAIFALLHSQASCMNCTLVAVELTQRCGVGTSSSPCNAVLKSFDRHAVAVSNKLYPKVSSSRASSRRPHVGLVCRSRSSSALALRRQHDVLWRTLFMYPACTHAANCPSLHSTSCFGHTRDVSSTQCRSSQRTFDGGRANHGTISRETLLRAVGKLSILGG